MDNSMAYRIFVIFICSNFLTACAMFQGTKQNDHDAICKELTRQIIWSGASGTPKLWGGATGDPMQSTQQIAENETLMRNYRQEGCRERRVVDDGST
jgi:hypothetical protein